MSAICFVHFVAIAVVVPLFLTVFFLASTHIWTVFRAAAFFLGQHRSLKWNNPRLVSPFSCSHLKLTLLRSVTWRTLKILKSSSFMSYEIAMALNQMHIKLLFEISSGKKAKRKLINLITWIVWLENIHHDLLWTCSESNRYKFMFISLHWKIFCIQIDYSNALSVADQSVSIICTIENCGSFFPFIPFYKRDKAIFALLHIFQLRMSDAFNMEAIRDFKWWQKAFGFFLSW